MKLLLPLIPVIIWAGNTVVNKLSVETMSPGAMSFYRWAVAVLVLTPFCLPPLLKNWQTIRPLLPKLAALASLGMVLNQSLGYFAAESTTATNMALIMALVPLISMFISVPLLGAGISLTGIGGAFMALAGLVEMLTKGAPEALIEQGINRGDGLVLIASLSYALYCVLLKRWQLKIKTLQSVYVQGLFAVFILFPLFLTSERVSLSAASLPLVGYAGIFASVLAPLCWLKAIEAIGASRSAMFMNLMPAMTALIAVYTLGETLAQYHYIGGLMVLCGVAISQMKNKEKIKKNQENLQSCRAA
ncbi:DMT family transporter [Veronia pacifica]|uniref:Multidrug DMT transporter n=1 Tax=Veronia pacifica TaxID=1080227 RepID=A0A1C3EST7_9GAMM|nr:DMT family transporter [Veronia pacifica]ODA36306.1 multidrug DMT transporter [Veronia pacifica]